MIIKTPSADELHCAPELGILAALEAALAIAIPAVGAAHPELYDDQMDPGDYTLDVTHSRLGFSHHLAAVD